MNIAFFLLYCLLLTITPGPTNIVIFSTVQNYGVKKAVEFCYGAILAFAIILVLSVFLNSFLTSLLPEVLFYMQIIGSLYILYLAYLIFNMDSTSISNNTEIGTFKIGFFIQFINPKALIFCLTVFPSFIMPYYSNLFQLLAFALLITIIAGIAFFSWVLFGKLLKTFLQKYQKLVNILMSIFLVYCAYIISDL